MDEDIRPGKWLYGLAVFILVAGIAAFVALLVTNIGGIVDSNKQVVVPGSAEIVLEKTGEYTVYHEYVSVVGDKIYRSNQDLPGLKCTITDKSTNEEIGISVPWGSSNYHLGSREGVSVFKFTIDKPGTYILSAGYGGNAGGPETVLAVGEDMAGKIILLVFGGIGILFVSIAAFIIIMVVTTRKRRRSKLGYQGRF